jgi:chromosome segregation protein
VKAAPATISGAHKGMLVIDKGAHYHRCDFQVHSPRDRQWTGADCVTDDGRMAYGTRLVEACRERGVNAIAITDHHDMTFIPFVKRAALAETDAKGAPLA